MVRNFLDRVARRFLDSRPITTAEPVVALTNESSPNLAEAIALHESGQLGEARERYLAILDESDTNAEVCRLLGVLSSQEGDSAAAIAWIRRALDIDPGLVRARSNLGLIFRSLGQLDQAEGELRRAIEIDSRFDEAYANLALVLLGRGDLQGAEDALSHSLALNPGNADALNNLGNLCKDSGRLESAEEHYRKALALRPGSAIVLENIGAVAIARLDWVGAACNLRAAIEADGGRASAWSSLGYVLSQAGFLTEAEAACRRAIAIRPDWPGALVNLATVLKTQGDLPAAEEQCRHAIAVNPGHIGAQVSLGLIRQELGDLVEAETYYARAIELDPTMPSARYNLGVMRLLHSNYSEGFALFESRFKAFPRACVSGVRARLVADTKRRWNGGPLKGQRLLLWSEQGFGDSLMVFRFLSMLGRFDVRCVTLACERELQRIAERIPGITSVINSEDDGALPEFDLHCPLMSLPFCFRTSLETIPFSAPYISAPIDAVSQWAFRLAGLFPIRVGIVWAGSPTLRDDAKRNVTPPDLAPLAAVCGVHWVSLQKGHAAVQIGHWEGPILDPMDDCHDFLDTAALIENLDLVIAVDTAVAHLAGAMGKPVWLLNRAGSEWRWGVEGERTPWYPSMRIFRQRRSLDWHALIVEVAQELDAFCTRFRSQEAGASGDSY